MTARPDALKSPFEDERDRAIAGRFGMTLFLVSLGVLFAATALGLVVVRIQLTQRGLWPDDLPAFPRSLWLGTLVLAVSSGTMHAALTAARRGRPIGRWLAATAALGSAFLGIQAMGWLAWLSVVSGRWEESEAWRIALTGFYVLTGIHGLHVIGGLAGLARTTRGAARGRYTPEHHHGVVACSMYWHFLGAAWLAIFAMLCVS
jgi:cytochrome c oxidase subunit 3